MPGHLFEGHPVSEGTTRRGTDTPVHHPETPEVQVRRSDRARRQANSFRRPSKPFQSLTHLACFPGSASGKEPACQCRRQKRLRFNPWVGKIPWRRAWQPTPAFLPGESHGPRSLAGYTWGCKELDTTEAT